jgi:hypothetical protein
MAIRQTFFTSGESHIQLDENSKRHTGLNDFDDFIFVFDNVEI